MTSPTRRGFLAGLTAAVAPGLVLAASPVPVPRPVRGVAGSLVPVAPSAPALIRATSYDLAGAGQALINGSHLTGRFAYAVADAATGEILDARNGEEPMAPASTAKAITTGYALEHLGPAYRFRTRLLASGPLRQGRLEGDLILAGGGDPTLTSDDLGALLDQLAGLGVAAIAGRFLVWDGALPHVAEIDPGQPDHLDYNPAVSGLNLNFNRVHFQWEKKGADYAISLDARASRAAPKVKMVSMSTANRSVPIYTLDLEDDPGHEVWTVARPALGAAGSRWLPVRDTARYAAEVMRTMAATRKAPLVLPEPVFIQTLPADAVPVAMHPSAELAGIARDMLKYSTNLTAEILGLTATVARTGRRPADLAASATEMSRWGARFGMTETALVDHSGLGPASRVTARDMTRLLSHIGVEGPLRPLMKTYGLTDKSGKAEPFVIDAKTGTLNFVSCLVGYILRNKARPLVFAVLTAEPERRAQIRPGDEEKPAGSSAWTGRSRQLQLDLCRLWGHHA